MFDMGKRICKLRRDAHLSQKQLGEKIGKSASTRQISLDHRLV